MPLVRAVPEALQEKGRSTLREQVGGMPHHGRHDPNDHRLREAVITRKAQESPFEKLALGTKNFTPSQHQATPAQRCAKRPLAEVPSAISISLLVDFILRSAAVRLVRVVLLRDTCLHIGPEPWPTTSTVEFHAAGVQGDLAEMSKARKSRREPSAALRLLPCEVTSTAKINAGIFVVVKALHKTSI